ncbi:UNVERIFIED_CONTAM: hypothetical protein RMT77_005800 [Armadillidium vulgare]
MDIKSEIEIKMEELVPDYDFSQDYQSFPHNESMIPLAGSIKRELDENSSFIKSEPRESDLEFVFNEEKIKNNVIKSENSPMKTFDVHHKFMSVKNVSLLLNKVNQKGLKAHFESDEEEYFAQLLTSKFPLLLLKKFSHKELMTLMINAAEEEKDLEGKSTSKSKPQRAEVHQQNMEKYHVENLSCRHCNFSFKSKDELKTHLKTHNKRKFKCAHCSYEFSLKSTLKNHMLTHSNIKYKCSHCSYECNRKGNLKTHMLTHTNVKLFKCSYCSYECNLKGNLKSHMLTHTNVKIFKCSDCSYECNFKRDLKTHILNTHTNVKLFKCSDCSYKCNQKGHLNIHMLTHANVKLFKCSDCSYKCNQKGHLKTHMLTHANVKLFKCSDCSYECNQKGNLKRHKLNKH